MGRLAVTVGVIGLGEIGRGVAEGLARAGTDLVVCDVRPEATGAFAGTARVAATPGQVGGLCDVVVVAVVDDPQVRAVLAGPGGALAAMAEGTAVVVLSTIPVAALREVAAEAAARGVAVVDCGVSGGPSAAAEGQLVSMVGGRSEDVERVRPVLEAFSSEVVAMGPLGAGLQAKLARNLVQYVSWMAAHEAQRLAEAAGVKLSRLARVIKASDARIGGAAALMFRPTAAPFGPDDDAGLVAAMRIAAGLAHKDLRAALDLAGELGVALPVTELAEGRIDAVFGIGAGE